RTVEKRSWAQPALVAITALALILTGASPGKKKKKEPPPPKVSETVGDLAFVVSRGETKVEGVGLVVGLDNTGADPPPSWYRKQLVDEMSKAGVEKAEKLLANAQVSMVIVRLTIPIGVNPKDKLDVQVEVPPACGTKSLAGGYLLLTRLHEVLIASGSPKTGADLALAYGPVMIGTPAKPNDPKVGRVLGGGRVKKDFPYTLAIKDNRKSFHTSRMLETIVNERFHQTEDGRQKGVATAKTDSFLILKVPALYHQNQEHFFRVVQLLPMVDGPELRERRIAAWTKELQDPKTAGIAAMKLESVGNSAIDPLKTGLKSANSQIRYFCAEALAYLNDISGVDTLAETVARYPEFRAYSLAALAALDQPASHLKLRKLMDEPEIEVRYGAFNALRTLDPHDPFLGHVRVLEQPKREDDEEEEAPDAMALAIATASSRNRARQDDPFSLYVVDSEGPPLVHVSRTRRPEIVIFGRQQKLMPPIVLGAGAILLNAAINDEKVELSKIVPSRIGDADMKLTTTLDLAEVVRRTANLGATYPEIVSILESASRQKNLSGELVVDAVPNPSHLYLEAILGKDTTAKRDDALVRTGADSAKSRRRRFFGLLRREADVPIPNNPAESAGKESDSGKSGQNAATITGSTTATQGTAADPGSSGNAKKGKDAVEDSAARKDDALQKASLSDPPSRWRLSDLFRRSDD
ncbi:MAG TPA: flagellar basal body P-ring protein FlgI, partial [Isosphaeraceae bacterium]|nr:flagellar basal body P-ring protein FlgI [Isosphaeraceae bacterium]